MKKQAEEEISVSDVQGVQPTLTEARVREIIREEMDTWWKRQMTWLRSQTGIRDYEVK